MTQHGGDLDAIERMYNIKRNDIIDFSGNINPNGIPKSVKDAIIKNIDLISTYPDADYLKLRKSISKYINVPVENILTGNGSTELISLFIKTLKPKKGIIISPAYSEYEREIKLIGGEVFSFPLKEEEDFKINIDNLLKTIDDKTDLIVICNPNNPTGSYIELNETEKILSYCKSRNIFIMIDETYIEFADSNKNIISMPLVYKYDNIFVIRGTSKFFAIPGLRLGYCACSNIKILEQISKNKDPWSVNMAANIAGIVMFNDRKFIEDTKQLISHERKKIIDKLSTYKNIKLYDTQSNFILIKIINKNITASQIFDELIKYNIVIRDASSFEYLGKQFLRFCILSPKENNLLLEKLKIILG